MMQVICDKCKQVIGNYDRNKHAIRVTYAVKPDYYTSEHIYLDVCGLCRKTILKEMKELKAHA